MISDDDLSLLTRRCRVCGEEKPTSDFYFRRDQMRLDRRCKQCVCAAQVPRSKARRAGLIASGEYREIKARQRRAAGSLTREEISARAAARRDAEQAERAAKRSLKPPPKLPHQIVGSREWYAIATQEEIDRYRAHERVRYRKHYENNREEEVDRTRTARQLNPERFKAQVHRRIKRIIENGGEALCADHIRMAADRCVFCDSELGAVRCVVHLVPVALGGPSIEQNLVVSCLECRDDKAGLRADEWAYRLPVERCRRVLALCRERLTHSL